MRGNAEAARLGRARQPAAVLELMAAEPGGWTPIAGGTELMVAHAAGRLAATRLVSLWGIPDLRFIERDRTALLLAQAQLLSTFALTRTCADLPLMARGGYVDRLHRKPKPRDARRQSGERVARGRLFACSARLRCGDRVDFCARQRRIAYSEFHTGYKTQCAGPGRIGLRNPHAAPIRATSAISAQSWHAARHGHRKGCARRNGAAR